MKLDPRHFPDVPRYPAEVAYSHDSTLAESPVWEEREQALYWMDLDRNQIHRFDPASGKNTTQTLSTKVTSIARRTAGGLIASQRKNFAFLNPLTGVMESLDAIEEDRPENRFNDGKVDRQGRFWVGTMSEKHMERPNGALYRFDRQGCIKKAISDVTVSNGTGWSPDARTMYYTDTFRYTIFAYDFDPASGEVFNRRPYLEIEPSSKGLPDGLTVDAEGFVWSALVFYGCVLRLDPTGKLERMVTFQPTLGTSCTFGGADYRDLYITTARVSLTPEELANQPTAGSLLRCRPGPRGLAETPFAS